MSIGILWHDDSDRTLDDKVQAACARFAQKFSVEANTCYVHPSACLPEHRQALGTAVTMMVGGVAVKASRGTLKHCYFAVREESNED